MNFFLVRAVSFLLVMLAASIAAAEKPNIIFVLSDDAGYGDFGFHNSSEMRTPNLDRFAKQSMRFEQAYVTAAVCGPSRAGILTGKYQQRFGFEENNVPGYMSASCLPDDEMGLPLDQKTIADYMKTLGYRTALIGKWHQGNADRFHPLHRGFDEFYGFRGGARSYFAFDKGTKKFRLEDRIERAMGDFGESDKYLTDAFVDETISFVERNKDNPFPVVQRSSRADAGRTTGYQRVSISYGQTPEVGRHDVVHGSRLRTVARQVDGTEVRRKHDRRFHQ